MRGSSRRSRDYFPQERGRTTTEVLTGGKRQTSPQPSAASGTVEPRRLSNPAPARTAVPSSSTSRASDERLTPTSAVSRAPSFAITSSSFSASNGRRPPRLAGAVDRPGELEGLLDPESRAAARENVGEGDLHGKVEERVELRADALDLGVVTGDLPRLGLRALRVDPALARLQGDFVPRAGWKPALPARSRAFPFAEIWPNAIAASLLPPLLAVGVKPEQGPDQRCRQGSGADAACKHDETNRLEGGRRQERGLAPTVRGASRRPRDVL